MSQVTLCLELPQGADDQLTYPTTPEEVTTHLKRLPWSSSPGPDGVGYQIWKATQASAQLLLAVYNTCLLSSRIPAHWKASSTILIHKRGDEGDSANWRPISLQQTIYKILAVVMARRLAT